MKAKVAILTVIMLAVSWTGFIQAQDNYEISTAPYARITALANEGDYLWIGTEFGLTKMHKATEEKTFYHERLGDGLLHERSGVLGDGLLSVEITAMVVDPQGTLWIGTNGAGLEKFDGSNWQVLNSETTALPNDMITDLVVDHFGHLWIATDGGGAIKYDGSEMIVYDTSAGLPNNSVNALSVDNDGSVWFGTSFGLGKYDGQEWTKYTSFDSELPNSRVLSITCDGAGMMCIGTSGGLGLFDGENWVVYKKEDTGMTTNKIDVIATDPIGNIWIGNSEGCAKFDGENWTVYTSDNTCLSNNEISALTADSEGSIWIGTSYQLAQFDAEETWKEHNTCVLAGENTWSRAPDMPAFRSAHTASVVNGKIYVIGGYGGGVPKMTLSTVEEYDPSTDVWTTKADMPTTRWGHSASVANGKIYAIGGVDENGTYGITTVEEYDPTTDTWSTKTPMSTARYYHDSCEVNGKIYVIGGGSGRDYISDTPIYYSTVEEYDPVADTWTTKTDMPTPRALLTCCVVNGKIYAIGGVVGPVRELTLLGTVEEYDPVTDTWTTKSPMPTPRYGHAACAVNDSLIYAMGGADFFPPTEFYTSVEEYDPVTDTWTTKYPMPVGNHDFPACAVNNKIYITGGLVAPYPSRCANVYVFDPLGDPSSTSVEESSPTGFTLLQNYPNPFNPVTTINYRLEQTGMVSLVVYDMLGRKVETLVDEIQPPGTYEVKWNASEHASGVYFYRLSSDGIVKSRKMTLVK